MNVNMRNFAIMATEISTWVLGCFAYRRIPEVATTKCANSYNASRR